MLRCVAKSSNSQPADLCNGQRFNIQPENRSHSLNIWCTAWRSQNNWRSAGPVRGLDTRFVAADSDLVLYTNPRSEFHAWLPASFQKNIFFAFSKHFLWQADRKKKKCSAWTTTPTNWREFQWCKTNLGTDIAGSAITSASSSYLSLELYKVRLASILLQVSFCLALSFST